MDGRSLRRVIAGSMLLALTACSVGQPRETVTVVDEIPPGPGLFSGEDGEFVIYRR
ncbi:MAG: hypothetical protein ACRBM6_24130 [Geminicoccales bacterium]